MTPIMAVASQYSPQQQSYYHASYMSRQSSALSTSSMPTLQLTSSPSRSPSISSPHSALSPRVQLIPHRLSLGFDSTLSPSDREALDNTSFDILDLSSKDFDFEDIFTYDRPQQKLSRVVEVSSPTRVDGRRSHGERDWSEFSFSHYANGGSDNSTTATGTNTTRDRVRPSRARSGISEMYLRNGREARKR